MTSEDNEPVYFWRLEDDNAFLGQWYPASFEWKTGTDTFYYANAEQ